MTKAVRLALFLTAFFAVLLCLAGCGSENVDTKTASSDTHVHTFAPSDCVTPQTCSCGATKGKAVGHSWQDATCLNPKTCLACEETEGEPLQQDFVDGTCTHCKAYDPESAIDSPVVWISKDGKYHGNSTCGFAPDEEPVKSTLAKARHNGHHPCGRCYSTN